MNGDSEEPGLKHMTSISFFLAEKSLSNRGRKIKRGIFVKPNTMKKLIVFVKHYEKIHSVCKHYEKNNSVWQTL